MCIREVLCVYTTSALCVRGILAVCIRIGHRCIHDIQLSTPCVRLRYTILRVCIRMSSITRATRAGLCVYTGRRVCIHEMCVYTGRCFVYTRGFVCVHNGGAHLCMWRPGVNMLAIAPVVLEVCGPFVDLRSRCRRYPSSDRPVVRHLAGSPFHLSVHATDPKSALLAWRPVRTWCSCRNPSSRQVFFSCQIHDPEAVSASCIHLVDGL